MGTVPFNTNYFYTNHVAQEIEQSLSTAIRINEMDSLSLIQSKF